jgi:ABC-type transport system involved in multi-copper enzyme maturation permease subunit
MVGPVLSLELLRGSRRGRQHVFRWVYGGWLLAQFSVFALLYLTRSFGDDVLSPRGWVGNPSPLSSLTGTFLALLAVQQFLLLALAVPALTAGAVTEEKARGSLQDLLTTELSPWGIVAGKLLGRLIRVLDLSLPGWLLLGVVAAVGGLEPPQLLALVGGMLAPLPALGAAGLLASVWCRRTTNAAVAVYGLAAAVGGLFWAVGGLTAPSGPLYFLRLVSDNPGPAPLLRELLVGWLAWGGLALPLLALAAWRLRPAYRRQLVGEARGGAAAGRRPPIDDHPVRWKEQYIERVLDVPGLRRVPRGLGVTAVLGLSLICSLAVERLSHGGAAGTAFALQGLAVMALAGLAAGARASGAVCGERERQTWDALLLTPLTAKQLLRGKLWGTVNVFRPYLLAYTVPAVAVALFAGPWALLWAVTFWALTWVMMYYMAACGIACSVRAASSWKSWLSTLLTGYRGLLTNFGLIGGPCGLVGGSVVWWLLLEFRPRSIWWYFTVSGLYPGVVVWVACLVTGVLLFAGSEQFMVEAEQQLAQTDRIRQRLRVRPPAVTPA